MKIAIDAKLKTLAGDWIGATKKRDKDGNVVEEGGETVRSMSLSVCVNLAADEQKTMTGDDRFKLGVLAERLHQAPPVMDLEPENVTLLRERLGRVGMPGALVQAWRVLDQKDPQTGEDAVYEPPAKAEAPDADE